MSGYGEFGNDERLKICVRMAIECLSRQNAKWPYTLMVHPAHVENEASRSWLQDKVKRGMRVMVQEKIDAKPIVLTDWLAGKR